MKARDYDHDDFPDPDRVQYMPPTDDQLRRTRDWLRKLLREGPVYQYEVSYLAEAAGIRGDWLKRAKKQLGVVSENFNDQNPVAKYKVWFWRLPSRRETGSLLGEYED